MLELPAGCTCTRDYSIVLFFVLIEFWSGHCVKLNDGFDHTLLNQVSRTDRTEVEKIERSKMLMFRSAVMGLEVEIWFEDTEAHCWTNRDASSYTRLFCLGFVV